MFRQTASMTPGGLSWNNGIAVPVVAPWTTPGNVLYNAAIDPTVVPGVMPDWGSCYYALSLEFTNTAACDLIVTGDCVLVPVGGPPPAPAPAGQATGLFMNQATWTFSLPAAAVPAGMLLRQTLNGVLYTVLFRSVSCLRVMGGGTLLTLSLIPLVQEPFFLGPVFPDVNITGQGCVLTMTNWVMEHGGTPTLDAYQMAVGARDFGKDPLLSWMPLGVFTGNQMTLSMPASCVFVRCFDPANGLQNNMSPVSFSVLQQGSGF